MDKSGNKNRNLGRLVKTTKCLLNIQSKLMPLTGTLSGYFFLIFSPSALLFSNGCSSLYSHLMLLMKYSVEMNELQKDASQFQDGDALFIVTSSYEKYSSAKK